MPLSYIRYIYAVLLLNRALILMSCNHYLLTISGTRFNIKMPSYQYRKYHYGDKTVVRLSDLHNGISFTGKTTSLY